MTSAIDQLIVERNAALDRENNVELKVGEIVDWLDSLPPLAPGPSYDEIMAEMYDEHGLPR